MLKKKIDIFFLTVLIGGSILFLVDEFPVYILAIWLFLWLLITALGSFNIDWNYHLKSFNANNDITENRVAITFDDGPNPLYTLQVLELLKKYNAKGTFFCIGKNVENHSDIFNAIIEQGHTVGNHTYSHAKNFGFFSTKKVISELNKTNAIVKNTCGLEMKLYRPAYGVTNPQIKRAIKKLGMYSIGWSNRSFDTANLPTEYMFSRIRRRVKKGDVILFHDSSEKTLVVLERLLLFLREQNIESITVDALFNIEAYA